ncbi:membrane protein [Microbacterium phage Zooman]|nr:membrane protein [Microbacterium phage Zooman]
MILEIQDPGFNFTGVFWTGGIWLAAIIVMLGFTWATRDKPYSTYNENLFHLGWALTMVLGLVIFLLGGVFSGAKIYEIAVTSAKVEALEELGFEQADISGNSFTANRDGAYFQGILVPEKEDNTWSISEIVPPIPVEEIP